MRAPSVEDYARMTQAARLSAARLVEERIALIEKRRAELHATRQVEVEVNAALVRSAAEKHLERLAPDAPDVTLARQEALAEATRPARERRAAA